MREFSGNTLWEQQPVLAEGSMTSQPSGFLFCHACDELEPRLIYPYRWQQLSDGPLPTTFWEEAEMLETKLEDTGDKGFEWPLIGQSGELGKLMSMVSNDEVSTGFFHNGQTLMIDRT